MRAQSESDAVIALVGNQKDRDKLILLYDKKAKLSKSANDLYLELTSVVKQLEKNNEINNYEYKRIKETMREQIVQLLLKIEKYYEKIN